MSAVERITSIQQAFELFEAGVVRIPKSEDEDAQVVHPKIRADVARALGPLLIEDFLSGSYSRRVQVAPRLRDIDVVLILADPTGAFFRSATTALSAIRAAVLTSELVRAAEMRCRSVRAHLHDYEFTIDFVAALPSPSGSGLLLARRLPEECLDDWSWGNPKGQKQASVDKNGRCEGRYVPQVRTVKFWKDGACSLFKSYHAESILFHELPGPLEYEPALVRFFDGAYDRLAPGVLTEDPGAPGTYVDDRLDPGERAVAREAAEQARAYAHAAIAATSVEDKLQAWARVFGHSFAALGQSRDRMADSLSQRTAGVSGLGLVSHAGQPTVQPRSWRKQ